MSSSQTCVKALRSQISQLLASGQASGLFASPSEADLKCLDALVIGPEGTPYEGGFFHFDMKFPEEYPFRPPKVLLLTTDGKRVRFNPNLYASGKVCLSILGTWEGPGWSPVQSITTVLLSIQSLLCEKPYHNEPGFEDEDEASSERYNARIRYETLRVAVCQNAEAALQAGSEPGPRPTGPERTASLFGRVVLSAFAKNADKYLALAESEGRKYDERPFDDPFGDMAGTFHYGRVIAKLKELKLAVEARGGDSDVCVCVVCV